MCFGRLCSGSLPSPKQRPASEGSFGPSTIAEYIRTTVTSSWSRERAVVLSTESISSRGSRRTFPWLNRAVSCLDLPPSTLPGAGAPELQFTTTRGANQTGQRSQASTFASNGQIRHHRRLDYAVDLFVR